VAAVAAVAASLQSPVVVLRLHDRPPTSDHGLRAASHRLQPKAPDNGRQHLCRPGYNIRIIPPILICTSGRYAPASRSCPRRRAVPVQGVKFVDMNRAIKSA
jgi:hypothetical protein